MFSAEPATDTKRLRKLSRRDTRSSAIAMSGEGQAAKGLGEDDEGNANAQMVLDMDVSLVGRASDGTHVDFIARGLLLRRDEGHTDVAFQPGTRERSDGHHKMSDLGCWQ
jgi:hypothetical protein